MVAQRIKFSKLNGETKNESSVLNILKIYMQKESASEYHIYMTLKLARMLMRNYGTFEMSQELGDQIFVNMMDSRKSENYIRNVMKCLKKWSMSQGSSFTCPETHRTVGRVDFLRADEARALVEAAEDTKARSILSLMLTTGIRQRECVNLNILDFQPTERILWIRNNLDSDIRFHGVKNKSEEFVVVPPESARYLRQYLQERPVVATRSLYVTRDSHRYSARGLDDLVRRCAQRAGIQRAVGCHLLRHSMITLSCAAGQNLGFTQRQARHSSPVITQAIYNHSSADLGMLRNAIDSTKLF